MQRCSFLQLLKGPTEDELQITLMQKLFWSNRSLKLDHSKGCNFDWFTYLSLSRLHRTVRPCKIKFKKLDHLSLDL